MPTDLVLDAPGSDLVFVWATSGCQPLGWLLQLLHPAETQHVIVDTGESGDSTEIDVPIPESGSYQWRIRDVDSPESCWVYSNVVIIPD